ncbi:MAG: HNH endonuclease, partial [Nitrosopumilus sp.]
MIKINRAEAPRILQNTPRSESSYNNHNVTSVLLTMQFTKCAYCEKSIKEGAQVDHYIPIDEFVIGTNSDGSKRYNWTKANRWQNLLYSCVKCNGAKKRKNPFKGHTRVIIDPSNSYIDPEKYLDFRVNDINNINVIVSIIPKNKSTIGKNTINNLKLDIRRDHIGELNILAIEFENLFLTLLLKIKQGLDINHID